MKTLIMLSILAVLTGCQPASNQPASSTSAARTPSGSSTATGTITQTQTASVLRVKNYNQYNQSLSKLTGINSSRYNDLFEVLKGSLPAENEIGGLTAFNLIAMTRLADAYCGDFIPESAQKGLVDLTRDEDVKTFLLNQFLDYSDSDTRYSSIRTNLTNILNNTDGRDALFPNPTDEGLAVAACVSILASPYITLLE